MAIRMVYKMALPLRGNYSFSETVWPKRFYCGIALLSMELVSWERGSGGGGGRGGGGIGGRKVWGRWFPIETWYEEPVEIDIRLWRHCFHFQSPTPFVMAKRGSGGVRFHQTWPVAVGVWGNDWRQCGLWNNNDLHAVVSSAALYLLPPTAV